jgi:hypothetical protein
MERMGQKGGIGMRMHKGTIVKLVEATQPPAGGDLLWVEAVQALVEAGQPLVEAGQALVEADHPLAEAHRLFLEVAQPSMEDA